MTETNECTHGFAASERRHCVHCMYNDELSDRDAEIKRLERRIEALDGMVYAVLDDHECSLSTRDIIEPYYEDVEDGE